MNNPCAKFWIIGGEYDDVSFERVVDGTQSLAGPFSSYGSALGEWRRLTEVTRCNAHHRYVIAHEPPPRSVSVEMQQPAYAR
jgi:hypothetical protein